jgi:predicted RNA binding protein YcfA (HicA-like mRNA interferase family)
VKRTQLIKEITQAGCVLKRHGSRHDIYINPSTGQSQPVPRHREIEDKLVKHIKKYLGLSN